MNRLAKNYIYNIAYKGLVLITPIVTVPYLTRVLGATRLGVYSYVSSSGSIITTLVLLGIYAYGIRQVAYIRDSTTKLTTAFWEILATRIFLGIIGTFIYFVYAKANTEYVNYFKVYYPYILSEFIDCSWVFVGVEDMGPAVTKNFCAKLFTVFGIFIFVRSPEDLGRYILLLSVTSILANVSIYFQLGKYVGGPVEVGISSIIGHIKGSIKLFLPQAAALFYLEVDKVMIQWITKEASQLSYYDQAEKIISIPFSIITVLSTVLMPRLSNEYKKSHKAVVEAMLIKAGTYSLLLAFPLMGGLLCIARQFIPWYLGKEYIPTAYAIMLLVPVIFSNTLTGLSGEQYYTATDQIEIVLKANVTAAVVNILVNAIMIPSLGYQGAAVATVLSSFSSVLIQYHYLKRQIDLRKLIKPGARYFVFSLIMVGVEIVLTGRMHASVLTTLTQIILGVVIYVLLLYMSKDQTMIQIMNLVKKQKQV